MNEQIEIIEYNNLEANINDEMIHDFVNRSMHKFIGSKLYNSFEIYALEKNIKVIYLVCGQVLEKAHKFYKKMGYKQVDELEIEMHIAEDDDYFKKIFG